MQVCELSKSDFVDAKAQDKQPKCRLEAEKDNKRQERPGAFEERQQPIGIPPAQQKRPDACHDGEQWKSDRQEAIQLLGGHLAPASGCGNLNCARRNKPRMRKRN